MNSTQPAHRPTSRLANFAGTLIALITLVLPLWAIVHYSGDPRTEPLRAEVVSRAE